MKCERQVITRKWPGPVVTLIGTRAGRACCHPDAVAGIHQRGTDIVAAVIFKPLKRTAMVSGADER